MPIIQRELQTIVHEWNVHRVRCSAESPGGKPEILYSVPESAGVITYVYLYNYLAVQCPYKLTMLISC